MRRIHSTAGRISAILLLAVTTLVFTGATGIRSDAAQTYRMTDSGAILDTGGELFIPFGGFYGGWIPAQLDPLIDDYHLTQNLPQSEWRECFALLQSKGVNLIRIFSGLQYDENLLSKHEGQMDLAGHVHPDIWAFWQEYMNVGAEFGMRYQFVILNGPYVATYVDTETSTSYALPIYQREGWEQNRFVNEDPGQLDPVSMEEFFTDPEVVALQRAYLHELLPQLDTNLIAMIEIINEQGWYDNPGRLFWEVQDEEAAFTEEMIQLIRSYYPDIPIGFSHSGFGMLGMDPLRWLDAIPSADHYSFHFFPCISGETASADYGVIPDLICRYVGGERALHCGESGDIFVFVPEPERTLTLRDGIWTTMAGGGCGFSQWWLFNMPPNSLDEYLSARSILETHEIPLWHRKKSRWALDISAAAAILGASGDPGSKSISPPWTTMTEWDRYFRGWAASYDMTRDATGYERIFDLFDPPPPEISPDRPLQVTGPYEGVTYLAKEGSLVYLRNGSIEPLSGCYYRRKSPGPLELTLSIDEVKSEVVVYDLDDTPGAPAKVFDEVSFPGQSILSLGSTDHDFVVILRPGGVPTGISVY
jgi:hypothetical protein